MDIGKMFGDAVTSASQGMTDLLKQGGNAALGYLEGQAVSVIQADQAQHEGQFQNMTLAQLNSPGNPNGFGAYLQDLSTNPVLKSYGPLIIVAIGGIIIFGMLLK